MAVAVLDPLRLRPLRRLHAARRELADLQDHRRGQSVAPVHSSEAPGRGPRLSRRASRANLPVGRSSDGDGNVGDRGVAQHLPQ